MNILLSCCVLLFLLCVKGQDHEEEEQTFMMNIMKHDLGRACDMVDLIPGALLPYPPYLFLFRYDASTLGGYPFLPIHTAWTKMNFDLSQLLFVPDSISHTLFCLHFNEFDRSVRNCANSTWIQRSIDNHNDTPSNCTEYLLFHL